MQKLLFKSLFATPAVLGAALVMSSSAIAAQKPESQAVALPKLEVGVAAPNSVAVPSAIAEVKSLSSKTIAEVKPQAQASPQFSSKAALPTEPVKIAQAAPDSPSVNSLDQLDRYGREGRTMSNGAANAQVTSVSQLSDVRPTDWAFQALQSLVERYGCIAGYPDRTYRGNRALTRYEFAAGLNACLDRVNELIAASTADLVKKEDLATLQKLQEQFAAELATLRGRVDSLEARTATLEKQQFSTTTKLAGEGVFAVTGATNPGQAVGLISAPGTPLALGPTGGATSNSNNVVFQDRVRLSLNTSFTGKDLLVTRLAAGNAGGPNATNAGNNRIGFFVPGGGAEGTQTFNYGNTGGNSIYADWIAYYFNLSDQVRVYIPAAGGLHYDYAPTASPGLDAADGGTGPLSIFAQRNPIYAIGGGSGIGLNFGVNSAISISGGYLADNSDRAGTVVAGAFSPAGKGGLFNGGYSALGQINFRASDALQVALTYVNAYRRAAIFDTGNGGLGSIGTLAANTSTNTGNLAGSSKVSAYGASAALRLTPGFIINAFGSYISADFLDDASSNRTIWTYGVGLAFPDFGKKGNLLGLTAGVEPYLSNPTAAQRAAGVRNDLPLHFEGFYKYQLNDNISITPGVIWIVNPGQNTNNDDVIIGTVRTTFTF